MEDLYFTGWIFAIGLGFIKMVMGFSLLNSIRAQNLKKIDLYFHPFSGQFKNNPTSNAHLIFYVFYLLVLAPIFSWVSVISGVWPFIAAWTNKVEIPEKIREIQYKLATRNLTKEEVLILQNEVSIFNGHAIQTVVSTENDSAESNEFNVLKVGDNEWPAEFEIEPSHKRVNYYARTPDYDSIYQSVHEYKFENESVFIRTIEDSVDNYGKVSFHIKDNVVLESSLREQYQDNKFIKLDEQIKKYQERIKWSKVEFHKLRFFIMSFHPEVFPTSELRKMARQELERIKSGSADFEKQAKEVGCLVYEENDSTQYRIPENCDEAKKKEIENFFSDESISKFNLSRNELDRSKQIILFLSEFLGEKKTAA